MENFNYLKESISTELAEALVRDYNMSTSEALDTLFNSETYAALLNTQTGLYTQSPLYIYSYLKQEIETGKIG